ncbi:MAG: DUF6503 family protein [Bacteroidota bacterium]
MKVIFAATLFLVITSCKFSEPKRELNAQDIVNLAIEASGGAGHLENQISFDFRNRSYKGYKSKNQRIMERFQVLDSLEILDRKINQSFERFVNDSLIVLPDSVANRYANSVNSVHYFARLPFGLNDAAVKKTLLGVEDIKDKKYLKVKVVFEEANGGDDFEDTYIYWFNAETHLPDYLAYDFHVNGGGQRFREAYNERYVEGIRFVDYNNFKPKQKDIKLEDIGKAFEKNELELLSKIVLENVQVSPN